MSTPTEGQTVASMSDADFLSIDPSNYQVQTSNENADPDYDNDDSDHDPDYERTEDVGDSDEEDDTDSEGGEPGDRADDGYEEEYAEDGSDDPSGSDNSDDSAEGSDSDGGDDDSDSGSDEAAGELSSDELLAQIMAPFKANGTEMQANTPAEVRKLMEQGANYHKKMQGIAPHMKTVRTLTKEGITPEELNFMIDLRNKVPAAISRLMQDSGLSAHDLDEDEGTDYQATNHQVSDASMRLTDVLESLQQTETYGRFINEVGKGWDQSSRDAMGTKPEVMGWINDQMASGVYDLIIAEVARERTFGNLVNVSDLTAYQQVGETMNARGGFDHLTTPAATGAQGQRKAPADKPLTPKRVTKEDPKRQAARRAAGTVAQKPAKAGTVVSDFDVANLSDEEFMAQIGSKLS